MINLEQFQEKKFPVEVFPDALQELIAKVSETLNINQDYAAGALLFTFSSAFGARYKLRIKNGWEEGTTLFMALVGKPGINKSSPISVFTEPLEKINRDMFKNFQEELKDYKTKKGNPENTETLIEPILKQVILKDTTQEGMLISLFNNPAGLCCINDELAGFLKSFNKYRSGGGDEELILSLFSGKSISVNRKNAEPLLISSPTLSIIGSIQPQVLISQFGQNRIDNGLTHRFLFVYPDNVKREKLSMNDLEWETLDTLDMVIRSILKPNQIFDHNTKPNIINLAVEAFQYYQVFRERINEIINNEKSDAISGIYAKLDTLYFRLCLILHLIYVVCREEKDKNRIQLETAIKAEKLIDYFEYMALKVFRLFEKHRDPLTSYPLEHRIFYYQLPQTFATKDAEVVANQRFSKRTMFNILNDDYLFTKIKHGQYEKVW